MILSCLIFRKIIELINTIKVANISIKKTINTTNIINIINGTMAMTMMIGMTMMINIYNNHKHPAYAYRKFWLFQEPNRHSPNFFRTACNNHPMNYWTYYILHINAFDNLIAPLRHMRDVCDYYKRYHRHGWDRVLIEIGIRPGSTCYKPFYDRIHYHSNCWHEHYCSYCDHHDKHHYKHHKKHKHHKHHKHQKWHDGYDDDDWDDDDD